MEAIIVSYAHALRKQEINRGKNRYFYPGFNKTTYYLAKYNDRKCFNTLFATKGNYNFQDLLYSEFSI